MFDNSSGGARVLTPAAGLEDLYRRYAGWFRSRVVRRYGVQDAEDLVQETWTRLAASMVGQEVRHPRALLLQIVGNLFVDRQRRRARRSRYLAEQEVASAWAEADQPETVLVREIVLGLPLPLRDVASVIECYLALTAGRSVTQARQCRTGGGGA